MSGDDPLGELYAGCYQRLVVQLYAVTGDLNEAQEVVQEAFIRAMAAPRVFAGLDNREAWLRRVAINLARSRFRRRRALDVLLRRVGPPPVVADPSPDHIALMGALRRLPKAQRDTLALHYLVDLPLDAVADALGVEIGTVKSRLSRGRKALAELLSDREHAGSADVRV